MKQQTLDLTSVKDATPIPPIRFDGEDFDQKEDGKRLTGQILRVHEHMKSSEWQTLDEIAHATGDPHASISAQLRNLRKERFGNHIISKRPRGDRGNGLWEYKLEET